MEETRERWNANREIPDTVKLEENNDIEFDANAALFEEDEAASESEEEQSDEDSDDSDDSDDVAESIQRYRSDYGGAKDSRNTRRK
ncbi:unnamed protein product [Echinostoma caproni]|uniref:SPT6_acidic domain-containing protein n=1 Tax=Echinostoma caproni TaxID=27848 RepID=A0A183B8J6_9TREM|nr:unnamed protein product [Echinostoma caproni]